MEASMRAAGGTPPLDFETWAALSARLLKLDAEQRYDILEARGVSPEDWMQSEEQHFATLAADIGAGRMDRAEHYGQVCAAEMERRRRGEPEETPEHVEPEATDPMATASPIVGAPAVVITEEVPSYLRVPAAAAASPEGSLASTAAALEVPSFVRQAAASLPFGTTPSIQFLSEVGAPRPSAPASMGETAPLGVDPFANMRSVLPFPKSSSTASVPQLALETYASLCAELRVYPQRASEILRKYRIADEEARRALDAEWQARMSGQPATRAEWQRLCATYEGWLRNGSR